MRRLIGPYLLVVVWSLQLCAQSDTPFKSVQGFKAALDNNDLSTLCQYMAEDDGSGPLKRIHYEQMQRSIEGLVSLWRGVPFSYPNEPVYNKTRTEATIKVEVPTLSQEIKFTLLKFGNAWYIFDVEIYFRK